MVRPEKILLFLAACLFCGCASQMTVEEHTGEWIARPLSELKEEVKKPDSYASRIGWKETTYPLVNGDFVYVEPVFADCAVHWEVNPKGIIIAYQAKGKGCEHAPAENPSIENTKPK
jgi:hypothetical protein